MTLDKSLPSIFNLCLKIPSSFVIFYSLFTYSMALLLNLIINKENKGENPIKQSIEEKRRSGTYVLRIITTRINRADPDMSFPNSIIFG